MDDGLGYALLGILMIVFIIVLPIAITTYILYFISKNKIASIIGSIIGLVCTLIIGYGFGIFQYIISGMDYPLAPIVMSILSIGLTISIGLMVIKIFTRK